MSFLAMPCPVPSRRPGVGWLLGIEPQERQETGLNPMGPGKFGAKRHESAMFEYCVRAMSEMGGLAW